MDEFEGRFRRAAGRALEETANLAVNTVQNKYLNGGALNVRTGLLRRSISQRTDQTSLVATIGTNVEYAAIHEFGGEIRPKNAKALRFKIGDQWIMAKVVRMPARPFLRPGVRDAVSNASGPFSEAMRIEFS